MFKSSLNFYECVVHCKITSRMIWPFDWINFRITILLKRIENVLFLDVPMNFDARINGHGNITCLSVGSIWSAFCSVVFSAKVSEMLLREALTG